MTRRTLFSNPFVIPVVPKPTSSSPKCFIGDLLQPVIALNLLLNPITRLLRSRIKGLRDDEANTVFKPLRHPEVSKLTSSSLRLPPLRHPWGYHHLVIPEVFYRGSHNASFTLKDTKTTTNPKCRLSEHKTSQNQTSCYSQQKSQSLGLGLDNHVQQYF